MNIPVQEGLNDEFVAPVFTDAQLMRRGLDPDDEQLISFRIGHGVFRYFPAAQFEETHTGYRQIPEVAEAWGYVEEVFSGDEHAQAQLSTVLLRGGEQGFVPLQTMIANAGVTMATADRFNRR